MNYKELLEMVSTDPKGRVISKADWDALVAEGNVLMGVCVAKTGEKIHFIQDITANGFERLFCEEETE